MFAIFVPLPCDDDDRLCPGGTGFSFGNNHYPDFASASWLAVSDLLNISFIQMVFRSTSLGLGHRTQRAGQGPVRGTEIWGLGSFSCDPTQLGPKYSNFPVCLKRSSYSLRETDGKHTQKNQITLWASFWGFEMFLCTYLSLKSPNGKWLAVGTLDHFFGGHHVI